MFSSAATRTVTASRPTRGQNKKLRKHLGGIMLQIMLKINYIFYIVIKLLFFVKMKNKNKNNKSIQKLNSKYPMYQI